jgi:hypothetical protein
MEKKCSVCLLLLPLSEFSPNGGGKVRSSCKKCTNAQQKKRRIPTPRVLKYHSEEERKEAARVRSKEWYRNNTERAKKRISEFYATEHGKQLRRDAIAQNKVKNPSYWRFKKRKDTCIRRCRELEAGLLSVSALSLLETYNTHHFSTSSFTCEYCSSIIGNDYHLEHLTPISRGGTNSIDNLAKNCKTVQEFRPDLVNYFTNRNYYDYTNGATNALIRVI